MLCFPLSVVLEIQSSLWEILCIFCKINDCNFIQYLVLKLCVSKGFQTPLTVPDTKKWAEHGFIDNNIPTDKANFKADAVHAAAERWLITC